MITNIFGSVFSSVENMINDFDGDSYPIKKTIIGELSRSLIGNSQTTTDANLRIFYNFIQFAYKTHLYTANASLVDLFIAFLHGAEQGFFLEIGYSADRENSVTLFLEAYAGWRGVIVDDEIVDNLSIKALRRVEICSVNSFYESVVDASIDLLCVHNRNYIDSVISFLEGGARVKFIYLDKSMLSLDNDFEKFGYKKFLPEFFHGYSVFVLNSEIDKLYNRFLVTHDESYYRSIDNFELLSLHIPKCAGTSFTHHLRSIYADKLVLSYDTPPQQGGLRYLPITLGDHASCVHGHLDVSRYIKYNPKFLITFLRHPVERLVSYFFFLKAHGSSDPNINRIVTSPDLQSSFLELAKIFSNDFKFWLMGVDIEKFDFIGVVENYDKSLEVVNQLIGRSDINTTSSRVNTSPDETLKGEFMNNKRIVSIIEDLCIDDIKIYDYVFEKFHS